MNVSLHVLFCIPRILKIVCSLEYACMFNHASLTCWHGESCRHRGSHYCGMNWFQTSMNQYISSHRLALVVAEEDHNNLGCHGAGWEDKHLFWWESLWIKRNQDIQKIKKSRLHSHSITIPPMTFFTMKIGQHNVCCTVQAFNTGSS